MNAEQQVALFLEHHAEFRHRVLRYRSAGVSWEAILDALAPAMLELAAKPAT